MWIVAPAELGGRKAKLETGRVGAVKVKKSRNVQTPSLFFIFFILRKGEGKKLIPLFSFSLKQDYNAFGQKSVKHWGLPTNMWVSLEVDFPPK